MNLVKSVCVAAVAAATLGLPSLGKADTYNFVSSGGSVIGTATTLQVGANVQVTLDITAPDWFFIQAGNPPMIGFNTSATVNPTLITAPTQNPGGSAVWALSGSFNSGAAGTFTDGLGFTPKNNTIWDSNIVFTIGAMTLANFLPNADNFFFAADFCNAVGGTSGSTCVNAAGQAGVTAFVGAIATPLPPAVLLFLTGLVGMGLLGRRRRKQALAA